jgi:NADH-quinone oxidoreductase subunit F
MEKFLLRNVGVPNSHEIDVYIERGGYQALAKALKEFEPQALVSLVRESGLRGGAGFPAGVKWSFLPKGSTPATGCATPITS